MPAERNAKGLLATTALPKASKTCVLMHRLVTHVRSRLYYVALSLLYVLGATLDRGCWSGRGHGRDGTFHATSLAVRGSKHTLPTVGCRTVLRRAHGVSPLLCIMILMHSGFDFLYMAFRRLFCLAHDSRSIYMASSFFMQHYAFMHTSLSPCSHRFIWFVVLTTVCGSLMHCTRVHVMSPLFDISRS